MTRNCAINMTLCLSRRTLIRALTTSAGLGLLVSESNGQSAFPAEMLLGKWQRSFSRADGTQFKSSLEFYSNGYMAGGTVKGGKSIAWYHCQWRLEGNLLIQTGSGAIEGVVPPPAAPTAMDVTRTHSSKTEIVTLTATELVLRQVNRKGSGQKFSRV
jgi:hypothetical protein